MKENESVLDVLVYLFEHFAPDGPEAVRDRDSLKDTLEDAGFETGQIDRAFDWLDGLESRRGDAPVAGVGARPLRIYAEEECDRLDADCRGFLLRLEREGVLDAERRELVIDRLMALELTGIALDDLKWVVLMVLYRQPGHEAASAWIENHLLQDEAERVH
jgi:Smg protein